MVITPAFQVGDVGSIPVTRTTYGLACSKASARNTCNVSDGGFDSHPVHKLRKSYNGYYKALPRLRREFDSPLSLKDSSNVECYFVFPTTSPGSNPGFRSNNICGIGVRVAQYLYTQQVFSVLFGELVLIG